jgi:hypothetical protein
MLAEYPLRKVMVRIETGASFFRLTVIPCSHFKIRQRLVGIAALTGVVTSDALYHSASEFVKQVFIVIPGLLLTLYEADLDTVKVE